jgi:hypothetical protein
MSSSVTYLTKFAAEVTHDAAPGGLQHSHKYLQNLRRQLGNRQVAGTRLGTPVTDECLRLLRNRGSPGTVHHNLFPDLSLLHITLSFTEFPKSPNPNVQSLNTNFIYS